jgi:hypothetical protein
MVDHLLLECRVHDLEALHTSGGAGLPIPWMVSSRRSLVVDVMFINISSVPHECNGNGFLLTLDTRIHIVSVEHH